MYGPPEFIGVRRRRRSFFSHSAREQQKENSFSWISGDERVVSSGENLSSGTVKLNEWAIQLSRGNGEKR